MEVHVLEVEQPCIGWIAKIAGKYWVMRQPVTPLGKTLDAQQGLQRAPSKFDEFEEAKKHIVSREADIDVVIPGVFGR